MEDNKENILTGYPNVISYECTKKIIEQMEKNICKIKVGKEQGTGFFCKIPFPNRDNILPVFITNNHIINENILYKGNEKIYIKIKEENKSKILYLNNRKKYTNKEYDITIIEIKEDDNINNYLELDNILLDDILNDNNQSEEYIDETIYIIQYPENKLSVSYGIFDNIYEDKKYNFNHRCSTKGGSSGSPVLNLNNKVIGIHKEGYNNKYNIGLLLNYPIKEFMQLNSSGKLVKKFNNTNDLQHNIDIQDINITELKLGYEEIGNEGLKNLVKIEFKELKKLYLYNNNISNIEILENDIFEKLQILNLNYNQIVDIDVFEKVKFQDLIELNLSGNNISDIKILEKVKFVKLEILNLSYNKIADINILEKVQLKELKQLYLYNNSISDIKILEKVTFEKLEILNLSYNKIEDFNILEKVKFQDLKELYLGGNKISDLKVLENVKFEKLEVLDLCENKIANINILEKVKFKELKYLYLHYNKISDIKVLEKVKFEKLEILNLSNNKILDINILEKVKFKELEQLYLNDNKISDIKVLEKVKFEKLETLNIRGNRISNNWVISKLKSKRKVFYK